MPLTLVAQVRAFRCHYKFTLFSKMMETLNKTAKQACTDVIRDLDECTPHVTLTSRDQELSAQGAEAAL